MFDEPGHSAGEVCKNPDVLLGCAPQQEIFLLFSTRSSTGNQKKPLVNLAKSGGSTYFSTSITGQVLKLPGTSSE
jgi:hypothetical protein